MNFKNREISTVFKNAKEYLHDGILGMSARGLFGGRKYFYICWAINEVSHVKGVKFMLDDCCKDIIQDRLGEHYTLDSWLESRGIDISFIKVDRNKLQATRLAWLDSLEKEFDIGGEYIYKKGN